MAKVAANKAVARVAASREVRVAVKSATKTARAVSRVVANKVVVVANRVGASVN